MPLVVPGIQSTGGGSAEEWMQKLGGKKIGDQHDETVSGFQHQTTGLDHPDADNDKDLRQKGSSSRAPRPQGRLDDDHGPQARPVSLMMFPRSRSRLTDGAASTFTPRTMVP